MRITYLDQSTYLPDEVVHKFERLGEFIRYNDRPSREEAIRRLDETDIAILEWTPIDREMLQQIQRLRYIIVALTDYSLVDIIAAKAKGILVSNIPHYSRQSVAEHAFALALAVDRKLPSSDQEARHGKRDYFAPFLGMELHGKTLGVFGLGSIGSWVAQIGQGFGMRVLGTSRTPKKIPYVQEVSLEELLRQSDVFMACVSRNPSTVRILSRDRLMLMKKTALFISVVSEICDEEALAEMLIEGKLAGVGLDTPTKNTPLAQLPNTVLTTGIGWYTQDSLDRLVSIMLENVNKYIEGDPRHVVNADITL